MALNFPNSPVLNDTYEASGVTYIWDGVKWTSKGSTSGLPLVPDENGNVVIEGTLIVNGATITGNAITVSSGATLHGQLIEKTIIATGAPGNIDIENGNVHYYTTAGVGQFTLNFRRSGSETLDSSLLVGETVAISVLATTVATDYYVAAVQVDGAAQSVKWIGAEAPSQSIGAGVDAYSFQVIKTAANTFTVFGSVNNFG